ncbi:hypothetical protein BDW75DRAFT_203790 [Aspergillus navahoensis]
MIQQQTARFTRVIDLDGHGNKETKQVVLLNTSQKGCHGPVPDIGNVCHETLAC